jgi:hypothetical protein
VATRGTTAAGRLRRVDRWLVATYPRLLTTADLLVVDLGFGARPVTTIELAARVRARNAGARVVGLDIDPERVAAAAPSAGSGVEFAVGGFELAGLRPHVVRALNVLRQYDEADSATAWRQLTASLAPGGLVVEGTCDESGSVGAWVALDRAGPQTLTLTVGLAGRPSEVAARLPKALIHHNVSGQPINALLDDLDRAWQRHADLSVFGRRQRFAAAAGDLRSAGWPVLDGAARWRRGELTVSWHAVAPPDR